MNPQAANTAIGPEFLAGGGAMGERIRGFAWATTALGEPGAWPQGLRTAVRVLLTTRHPMFIFWGGEHVCLYNDAYARSLGPEKHPAILGAPGRAAWPEIWSAIGPQIDLVMRGDGATWHEDQLLPIIRHGELQEVYWTYSYSPIDEPAAPHGVGGVFVICNETTEHVVARQRLLLERDHFVRLFEQAPAFLALLEGPDHVFRFANASYRRVIGDRDVTGRRLAEALPEAVAQGYERLLDEVYRTAKPYSAAGARYEIASPDGGPPDVRYIDFIYQPMVDRDGAATGILVQGVDVTGRALADRALEVNRGRLDYATRLSGVGFWYCDLPFDVLEWDERVKEHFFFAPETRVRIDDFYARIHPEDRGPTRAAIEASILSRSPYDVVYRTVHPSSGAVKWIRALGGADYADDGTPTRFDGVTVDVTAQKLDQQRLHALNRELQQQDRRKDEFIATLSHELRNPLAPIRAAAKVISSASVEPAQLRRAQTIIERQVTHMSLLLDDLLDIARITQGKVQLRLEPVALATIVDAAVEAVRAAVTSKGQRLALRLPEHPVLLDADPVRLSQILSNLLMNAAKYSDPGRRIDVEAAIEGGQLRLSVRDEGIGIAAESIGRVFDMFAQIPDPGGRSDSGLGIGLALVKGLTELHGGTVEAHSAGLGLGSEFVVRLPLRHVLPGPVATKLAVPAPAPATRRRVLIADDNRDAAESLSMLLELAGHEVRVAYLGRGAIALAGRFRPDIALLDIGMPDMSGYEVARTLRGQPWGSRVRLIALTGWGQEADRQQAMAAGFDHHMVKPIDPDQLERLIAGETPT